MLNPYFLMAALYLAMGVLAALDSSFIHLDLLPMFAGIRWLRIHFITLGALTEVAFGVMPLLIAARARLPRPKFRWDIWLTLNLGLITLIVGIPLINPALMTTGGTLVFVAVTMLIIHLYRMHPRTNQRDGTGSRKFYITGLAYLLLGIVVGTGLWQGWGTTLQIKTPIEVHIHANNWGFLSLVFAGLIIDLYPDFTGRKLAGVGSVNRLWLMMTAGAFFVIAGPWVGNTFVAAPGLVLHLAATIWLLLKVIKPLRGDSQLRTPGILHLTTSYFWLIAPILTAPFVLFGVPGLANAGIEQNAPQALIYGWVLQFGYAMLPYLFRRTFLPDAPRQLGGNWFSLVTVHLGAVLLWVSIFQVADTLATLQGIAYGFWFVSMLPIVWDIWGIVRAALAVQPEPEAAL